MITSNSINDPDCLINIPKINDINDLKRPRFQKLIDVMGSTTVQSVAFIVVGIAFVFFYPPLAFPLIGLGSAFILGRLVIKPLDDYHLKPLDKLREGASHLNQRFPKLKFIAILVAVIVAPVIPILGLMIGIAQGAYCALSMDVHQYVRNYELPTEKQQEFSDVGDTEVTDI